MSPQAQRTGVVVLLAAVIGVRISATQPLADSAADVTPAPLATVATAFEGWTTRGTLGSPTVEGIRDLPLALYYLVGQHAGLSDGLLQVVLRSFILVVATLGALRLVRAQPADSGWTPWLAAALYGCGAGLAAAVAHRPMDALAAATAPWVLAPLAGRSWGWRGAARSAVCFSPR